VIHSVERQIPKPLVLVKAIRRPTSPYPKKLLRANTLTPQEGLEVLLEGSIEGCGEPYPDLGFWAIPNCMRVVVANLATGRKGSNVDLTIQNSPQIVRDSARCGGVMSKDLYFSEGLANNGLVWEGHPLGVQKQPEVRRIAFEPCNQSIPDSLRSLCYPHWEMPDYEAWKLFILKPCINGAPLPQSGERRTHRRTMVSCR
jgi:hypothetical protein